LHYHFKIFIAQFMKKDTFILLIQFLSDYFSSETNKEKIELFIDKAKNENPWFSDALIRNAMSAIQTQFFLPEVWQDFFKSQRPPIEHSKSVGLILAGNLPAVGMHDVLMTLASGNKCFVKLSSQDKAIMQLYFQAIKEFDSDVSLQEVEKVSGLDCVIATGSDFSANYFSQYFSTIPHIIRKNRTSVAVLIGDESLDNFKALSSDIFNYYGLGCRNVSSLYVPIDFDLIPLFDVLTLENWVLDHNKYSNNYQYQRTLLLLNQIQHFDLGNILVLENPDLVSPVGVLYMHRYQNLSEVKDELIKQESKIQCIVTKALELPGVVDFGQSQHPALTDFADGINTYDFLVGI
jgi:hypothetical protein